MNEPRRRWYGSRWVIGCVAAGIVIGAGIVFVLKFVDGPAYGNIASLPRGAATPTPTPDAVYQGKYVAFRYPGTFNQSNPSRKDANYLEQFMLTSSANYRRSIAVSLRQFPTNNLKDDPDYQMRGIKQDYTLTSRTISGEAVTVAVRSDHQEETLFWLHNGMVLTIAIVSSDTGDDVATFMNTVSGQVRWL